MKLLKQKRTPKYRFPWRTGNQFTLLVDGEQFYYAMLESIANAKNYILLEMYLFESGKTANQFIDAFIQATARGIQVCLLLDHYGALKLTSQDRIRLTDHNIKLVFYNPLQYGRWRRNLFRDHSKLLCVDGVVAFTGGAGICDEFNPQQYPKLYWHDAMIKIQGPNVQDWETLFGENWRQWTTGPLPMTTTATTTDSSAHTEGDNGQLGRLTQSRALSSSEVIRSFIKHIRGAERHAWLVTAYFVPPWKFRRALRRSAKSGVDVRIMLPGPHSDHPGVRHMGRRYYERLLRDGVRVFEYQPRFLHTKILLCDHWTSIGSSNVDRWNYRWNMEANQEVDDTEFSTQVSKQFEADFQDCIEFHYKEWRHRSRYRHLLEWFWGRIVAFLASIKRP